MSDFYGTLRENAARAPAPCHLEAPLREGWNAPVHMPTDERHAPLLAARDRIVLLGKDRHQLALHAASQSRLWRYPWPSWNALLHDGRLFHWVTDSEVQIVDLETGRPDRSLLAPGADRALASGPFLAGHSVDYDYGGARLYALDWTTGRRLWSLRLSRAQRLEGVMTASEDVLVFGIAEPGGQYGLSSIVAVRLDTGRELWRKTNMPLTGIAAVHGDRLIGSSGSTAWALALQDGALLWQSDDAGEGYLYGDRFYTCGYNHYTIFDVASGKTARRWDLSARAPKSVQASGSRVVLVSETHVYIVTDRHMLLAFTRDSGEYVYNHHPKGAYQRNGVACVGGRLYYQNGPDRLYCLEPRA